MASRDGDGDGCRVLLGQCLDRHAHRESRGETIVYYNQASTIPASLIEITADSPEGFENGIR